MSHIDPQSTGWAKPLPRLTDKNAADYNQCCVDGTAWFAAGQTERETTATATVYRLCLYLSTENFFSLLLKLQLHLREVLTCINHLNNTSFTDTYQTLSSFVTAVTQKWHVLFMNLLDRKAHLACKKTCSTHHHRFCSGTSGLRKLRGVSVSE